MTILTVLEVEVAVAVEAYRSVRPLVEPSMTSQPRRVQRPLVNTRTFHRLQLFPFLRLRLLHQLHLPHRSISKNQTFLFLQLPGKVEAA